MTVVLDASAGVEIILKRLESFHFHELFLSADEVMSSDLYKAEVANTVWKYVLGGYSTKEQALALLAAANDLNDEYMDIKENCAELENPVELSGL